MIGNLAVVVLAGGDGRRMGGEKPRRLLQGRPLIDWALDLAFAFSPHVAVSVRRTGQAGPALPARDLPDPAGVEGPMAGLWAGLDFAQQVRADRLLLLPCDAPHLPEDLAEKLGRALDLAPRAAALAMSGDRLHPACSLWTSACVQEIQPYLEAGRSSLRGFAEQVGYVSVAWADSNLFSNVNTQLDLALAETGVRVGIRRQMAGTR